MTEAQQAKIDTLQSEMTNLTYLRDAFTTRCHEIADEISAIKAGKRPNKSAPMNHRRTKL